MTDLLSPTRGGRDLWPVALVVGRYECRTCGASDMTIYEAGGHQCPVGVNQRLTVASQEAPPHGYAPTHRTTYEQTVPSGRPWWVARATPEYIRTNDPGPMAELRERIIRHRDYVFLFGSDVTMPDGRRA